MTGFSRQLLAVSGTIMILAGVMGATLGVLAVQARTENLVQGQNLIAGPFNNPLSPEQFISCLPQSSVSAMYKFVAPTTSAPARWQHFFTGVPAWVNLPEAGGIAFVSRVDPVFIIMNQAVPNATIPQGPQEVCN